MTTTSTQPIVVYPDLSYQVINAAYEVHNQLGPGFTEDIYEQAFIYELQTRQIPYEQQKVIQVKYKDKPVGLFRLDLLVDEKIIVELKAVTQMQEVFKHQLHTYLKATGLSLGLLINFGNRRVEQVRIINTPSSYK